jgi:hypothetical protein
MPACPVCNIEYANQPNECPHCGWFLSLRLKVGSQTYQELTNWAYKTYMKSSQNVVFQESSQPGVQLPLVPRITSSVNPPAGIERTTESHKTIDRAEVEKIITERLIISQRETEKMIIERLAPYQKIADAKEEVNYIIKQNINTEIAANNLSLNSKFEGLNRRLDYLEEFKRNIQGIVEAAIEPIRSNLEKYINFRLSGTSMIAPTSTSTPRSGSSTMPPSTSQSTGNNVHESQDSLVAFKLVEEYNKTPDRIPSTITSNATCVGMERDRLASSRDSYSLPVLNVKPSGNYLVAVREGTSYLVPNKKEYFDEYAYKTAILLYDCQGYSDHYTQIELIRPALVTKSADNEWTLANKGILKFI